MLTFDWFLSKTFFFSGLMLSVLSNISQFEVFDLSDINFGGVVPQDVGKSKALRVLDHGYNNLTGKILILQCQLQIFVEIKLENISF